MGIRGWELHVHRERRRRTKSAPTRVVVASAAALLALAPLASGKIVAKPKLSVADARIVERDTGTRNVVFSVRRAGATTKVSRVRYVTANGTATAGSDYTRKSGSLSFVRGQKTKTIAVPVRGDRTREATETFFVRLLRPSGARIARAQARGTIVNDDSDSPPPPPPPPQPPPPPPPPPPPGNSPPVSNAGNDQSVNVVARATLNGTGSTDPDGSPLTYSWSLTSRPPGSAATLVGATSATPHFDPDLPGAYVVQLIVSDGTHNSNPDTVSVTAVSQVVRFAALGAMGQGNQGQLDVAAAMQAKCAASGCDYIVGLGNNIYDTGVSSPNDVEFQTKFYTPYTNINLPFWMLLGNHDYGGGAGLPDDVRAQHQVDHTAISPNGKWRMPAKYYRRVDQHVEFFTLDTTKQVWGQDAQQELDVESWITSSSAYWKIALGLHSYRSNGNHGNAGNYDGVPFPPGNGIGVKDFMEDHVCGRAQVHLSAHDHTQQWLHQDTVNCSGTELIVSGTGANTTALEGSNPTYFETATLGFVYVVIRDRQLTAEFINTGGTILFTRTITR